MKKKLPPVVFRSAPGGFADALIQADAMSKKFYRSNLDAALHRGVENCTFFVMPAGRKFAYCRGTGPVTLARAELGRREKTSDGTLGSYCLLVEYRVVLFDEDRDEDVDSSVVINVPSRFIEHYVERAETKTRVQTFEFVYSLNDLTRWMHETKCAIYQEAEDSCVRRIAELNERISRIRAMGRDPKKIPRQSAFDAF